MAAAAIVAGGALMAAPAARADAKLAAAPVEATVAASAPGWVYYGYFPNTGACNTAGQRLVASGWTTKYRCDYGPWVTLMYVWAE
ncbi:hypothetical protein OG948_43730 (plasmid) [Embleya sp. NBC_00888]|uniref:hypothetical protein n=1 Tax=Embleya sp. NBC_00888 TaxID=2975960 RepID=UPI002F90CFAC|nr:hypothetical protein OG948_43730 [Embleya sp. NBC_00888]